MIVSYLPSNRLRKVNERLNSMFPVLFFFEAIVPMAMLLWHIDYFAFVGNAFSIKS